MLRVRIERRMSDWKDLMPEGDEPGVSIWDALMDVGLFLGKVVLFLVAVSVIVALVVYSFFRELLILNLLMGGI